MLSVVHRLPIGVAVSVHQSQVRASPWWGGRLTVGPRGPLMGTEHLALTIGRRVTVRPGGVATAV